MINKNTNSPDYVNHSFIGLDYKPHMMGFIFIKMEKICTKCHSLKLLTKFCKHSGFKDGINSICKTCSGEYSKQYYRTKDGLIKKIYLSQKNSSKLRKEIPLNYSIIELSYWLLRQSLFHKLYENWKLSNYSSDLRPSCDRKDDYKPYSICNIQLMTWRENRAKGWSDRRNGINNKVSKIVLQMDLNGTLINQHHSIMDASRNTCVSKSNISNCCNGKGYYSAGGYLWIFKK